MTRPDSILKTYFASLKEPVVFIDRGFRISAANQSIFKYFGIKKSETIGRLCYEALYSAKRPCASCPSKKTFKTKMSCTIKRLYQDKEGRSRHLQIETMLLKGPLKEGEVVVETIRDITDIVSIKDRLKRKRLIPEGVLLEWAGAKTSKDILEKVCGYVVEQLGYKMVWVGLIKEGSVDVVPMFSVGFEKGYLSSVKITYNDSLHGMGPTGMCIKTGTHQLMRNIPEDPKYEPWRKEAMKRGYLSSAAFPLVSKGRVIGALNIYSDKVDAFSEDEVETLKALSTHAAIALENTMLIETISKGQKQWEATFDSIRDPIFIHDNQYRIIMANKAYIEISGTSFADVIGRPYWEVFPKRDGPLASCEEAVKRGVISRTPEEIETPTGRVFISDVFPIFEDGKPLSFVHILKDVTELTNAKRKIEEEAKILSCLLELTTTIGRLLDIEAILEEVSKAVMKLTSSERTAIFLQSGAEGGYKAVAFHGWYEHHISSISTIRLRKGDMPAIDMLLKGEDVYIENAISSEFISQEFAKTLGLRTVILSPFITGEGVPGAIMAEKEGQFSADDRHILKGITSNTAIALENARLYKESIETASDLARRVETIRTTYEIDRTILSTLNRNEIIEIVVKNTQRIIPADKVITIQLNEDRSGYQYKTAAIPFGTSPFLDSVIRGGRLASIPNLALHKYPDLITQDFIKEGLNSLISLPLYTKGARFGCIIMASKRIGAFDKDDIANGEKLTAQVSIALENAKLYEDIKELFLSIIMVLVSAVDAKSPWTKGHSERVTEYALLIAGELGLGGEEIERLRLASLLHDIGKIGTYDVILDKPERLTEEEFALVKKHPARGAEILEPIKQLKDIVPIIRAHHEKIDGSGYPDGLKGDEIPFLARILCVADSFDSMTADRPYRPAPGKEYAISELKRCEGSQFDPVVVESFLKVIK